MKYPFYLIAALAMLISAHTCKKVIKTPDITRKLYQWEQFCMGDDLSYVNQVEDYGGIYRDSGKIKDPFKLLKTVAPIQ